MRNLEILLTHGNDIDFRITNSEKLSANNLIGAFIRLPDDRTFSISIKRESNDLTLALKFNDSTKKKYVGSIVHSSTEHPPVGSPSFEENLKNIGMNSTLIEFDIVDCNGVKVLTGINYWYYLDLGDAGTTLCSFKLPVKEIDLQRILTLSCRWHKSNCEGCINSIRCSALNGPRMSEKENRNED